MGLEKILKNLKKGLVITAGFVLPSLGIGQTAFYGDQVLNPGAQPNVKTGGKVNFDYRGGGDINGDFKIDNVDRNLVASGNQNWAGDINLDGINNSIDVLFYDSLLSGQIKYFPTHGNLLQIRQERENWFNKFYLLDSVYTIPSTPTFDCDERSLSFLINSSGIENISSSGINFNAIDTNKNASGNIPIYTFTTKDGNNNHHMAIAYFVGDTVTKFNDWKFKDMFTGANLYPGHFLMNANSYANLERFSYFWDNFLQTFKHSGMTTIDFNLTSGQSNVSWQHPNLVTTRHIVPVNPTATLPGDTLINYQTNLNVDPTSLGLVPTNVSQGADWFVSDSSTQIMNGGIEQVNFDIYRTFTLKPWHKYTNVNNVVQKEYPYHWLSTVAGVDTIHIEDIEKPVYVSFPVGGNPIVTDNSGLPVVINYTDSVTQDPDTTKCGHYTYYHIINWTATDVANNSSDSSVVENVMKPNQLVYDYVPNDTIVPKNGDTSVVALGSAQGHDQQLPWYFVNVSYVDSFTGASPSALIYQRKWSLEDICGQTKDSIQYIAKSLIDGTEDNKDIKFSYPFPNPTSSNITVDLGKTYKSINVNVRNTLGQIVLTRYFKTANLISFEIGDAKGIYFVELQTSEGNSTVFKVLKK